MKSDRSLVFTFSVVAFLITSAYIMAYLTMLKRQLANYGSSNLKRLSRAMASFRGDHPVPDFYRAQYRLENPLVDDLFTPAH